jgi:4-amino-4-deoxy-L-arabinose transferase-like glycosyltransferase
MGFLKNKILFNDTFWLLLLCFTFRNIFDKAVGPISFNADSATYYLAANNLMNGFIDNYRTPLYPLILKFSEALNSRLIFEYTVYFQQIISFASIIPFYLISKYWFKNKPIALIASLVYGCHPSTLYIIYGIFAESLLISFFVFFLYFFYIFITKPTASKWVLLHLFVFIMVMLKPLSVILYLVLIIMGVIIFIYDRQIITIRLSYRKFLLGYIVSFSLLAGYCMTNKIQNNFLGISTVNHDNNFANVVLSGAYNDFSDEKLISVIDTARYYGHYYTIYYLNNDHDKYKKSFDAFPSQYKLNDNMEGVKRIPSNNLGYNRESIAKHIKKAMRTKTYINYILNDIFLFSYTKVFYIKGYIIYLILYLEIILILYKLIFNKRINYLRLMVFITGTGILFASLIGGINDGTRERVLLPVIPFLILMSFDILNQLRLQTARIYSKKIKKI